jgi:hypothetical protein
MKKKLGLMAVIFLLLCPMALASGIKVFFTDTAIVARGGEVASTYHNYKTPLEFFYGSLPAPNSSAGRMAEGTVRPTYTYTPGVDNHKYILDMLSGGTLYVRFWSGPVATQRSYYGKAQGGVSSGIAFPTELRLTSSPTDYKADVPNKPKIGTITESLIKSGDSYQLTLVIPNLYEEGQVEPGGAASDGKREITNRYMLITYPEGTPPDTQPGENVTLSNTPAGTYKFKPYAQNVFTPVTEGDEVTYVTGQIGGAAGPINYPLLRVPEGIGLNPVAVLHDVPFNVSNSPIDANSKATVTKIRELITAINAKSGRNNTVTTFGWMENGELRGLYINYNEAGEMTGTPTVGVTEGLDTPLVRGKSYQIGVHVDVPGGVTFSQ